MRPSEEAATAAGAAGLGAAIGTVAGPVGVAFGAVTGLAVYGLTRLVRDMANQPPEDCPHCAHPRLAHRADGRCAVCEENGTEHTN